METETIYHNPEKAYQGADVPEGETMGDFIRWWKAQCAVWDAKPKHIVKSEKKEQKKAGKR